MKRSYKLTRRTFLSLSAAMAAYASAWPVFRGAGEASASVLDPGMTATPSFCEMCFWKCGINAWKNAEGRVVQITGHPTHPLANGHLCPRGTGGVGALYDPDRIKQPMIRKGDSWQPASWDEALGYIAEKMQAIKAEHGSNGMALISHGHGASFLHHTMRAFGSSSESHPSFAQCRGARDTGFMLTFGSAAGSPEFTDMENSTLMVFIGTHLGENMHNTQVQEFAKAVDNGVELIVVDPRYSVAAGKAKHWLPIKPGTDIALLLAWIRLLIEEGSYNRTFVERYCTGLNELRAAVSPYTPEWAYTQTGIEPETIRRTGRMLGMHQSTALVHPGRRSNWYGDDSQRSRAVAILNALLGNWGHRGGFWQGHKLSVGKYPYPGYPKASHEILDLARKQWPLASSIPTQFLRDHTVAQDTPKVKGWIVYGADIFNDIPLKERTIEAIKQLDLLVVVDTLPIELTGWADVVLPDTTYLERFDDLHTPLWKKPYVALRQPVVEPLYDSKPAWWIARELAMKLGLEKYYPWEKVEEYLDYRLRTVGLNLDLLKEQGNFSMEADPPYTDTPSFHTPSGKVELYSHVLEGMGFDPVPKFTPPAQPPPGFFRLLTGRVPVHSFGRTTNNPVLTELMSENQVWVNAITAKDFGLTHGEYVVLVNQDGVESHSVQVRVTQRIRPDAVFLPHGFGHKSKKLHIAYNRGAADNDLMTRVEVDPLMGATSTNTNFVTFKRTASA